MSVFKFASGGSLIVETSEDPSKVKTITATIDTWNAAADSGRRRMPRDSGTFVRFRDSSNGNSTNWLDLRGNVSNWGYQVKDTAGFWNVHVSQFLNELNTLIDPSEQSFTQ